MTSQPVEANVVLSTDNSQYDQAMMISAGNTDHFGKSVDSLGAKINNLSKSAGRHILGITAADVVLIGGATAAWASYEKQMSRLQAQAAITTRSRAAETQVLKSYTDSVKQLRNEFGTTTSEAAALTQQISKLSDNTRSIKDLSTTFEQMSMATGESSTGLANSLLNLQKIMGTPQTQTKNYADQLTYLAAKSNTTATALGEFTSQIAPMGRAMGMSQTQVTGFANMFVKAGQDGYVAATAFNKVAQDITYAVQTGSPDMLKYANVLGVTVSQFKQMSGAEQVAGFLDQISKMGPRAALELNRFGFDGIRMAKALTATVQSSGGAVNSLAEAQAGYNSNATSKGASAADSMSVTLAKLRQDIQQTAEAFGSVFGPGIDKVLKVVEMLASGFENLMQGPMGKFIGFVAGIAVPVTAAAGALLLMAGTLVKLSAAFMLFRGSPGLGFVEGLRGGSRIVPSMSGGLRTGGFEAFGGGYLGPRGAQIAEGGTWGQRLMYNSGQQLGGATRGGFAFLGGMGRDGSGPNIWSRGGARAVRFGGGAFAQQFDAMRYANPADRTQFLGTYFPGHGPQVDEAMTARAAATTRVQTAEGVHTSMMGAQGSTEAQKAASKAALDLAKAEEAAAIATEKSAVGFADAQMAAAKITESSAVKTEGVFATMRAEGANVARAMAGAAAGATKLAATTIGSGMARAGGGLMNALGGPVGLGITAAMFLPMIIPLVKNMFGGGGKSFEYSSYSTNPYLQGAGVTQATYTPKLNASETQNLTPTSARAVDARSVAAAGVAGRSLANPNIAGLTSGQATTFLGADYQDVKKSPQALYQMKLDLIQQYGPAGAELVLNNLDAGKYQTGAAAAASLWGAGQTQAAMALGVVQTNQAATAHGTKGGARQSAMSINQAFQAAIQPGANTKDIIGALNKQYGLSINADDIANVAGTIQHPYGTGRMSQMQNSVITQNNLALRAGLTSSSPSAQMSAMVGQLSSGDLSAMLTRLGLDPTLTGTAASTAINKVLTSTGGKSPFTTSGSLQQAVRGTGPAGVMFEGTKSVAKAMGFEDQNVGANVKAINEMMDKMRAAGMSAPQITKAMGDIQSKFDPSDPNYILAGMISAQSQQELQLSLPNMTRAQGFAASVAQFNAVSSIKPVSPEQFQNQQDAKTAMAQSMTDQENYFKQMLLMQNQYEIGRSRAQYDYTLQRGYEEHDYQLQRSRAEASFNRQRGYAVADYYRSVNRNQYNFDLQRQRSQDDFNHNTMIQSKQLAMSSMDIYQRVPTQRTGSASWLLSNAGDQLQRLRQMEKDLNKLRAMGFSDNVIQQLRLTDPNNAQQLTRFVAEVEANPKFVSQFNNAIGARVKAATSIETDASSLQWRELRRNFNLQQSRAQEDFSRQAELSREDFMRGLDRQRTEFNISMNQQSQDFNTQMGRQADSYALSMQRSAQDLANVGKEIDGTFEQVLVKATKDLTGHAQAQAKAVLASFKDLKNNTEPEAVALMESLAKIFGFKYTPPKGVNTKPVAPEAQPGDPHGHPGVQVGHAEGGVVPGWSPGRDDKMVPLSGGEAIMRPEWARAVGQETINQMNHQAKHGGFASGGIYRPIDVPVSHGPHDQYTGYTALDFAAPVGTPAYAVASGHITQSYDIAGPLASDTYHNAAYGPYGSYGRVMYLKTDIGPELIYAHLSKRGFGVGAHVHGGEAIAASGSTGNSSGPHLHFGDSDGNPMEFVTGMFGHGAIHGSVSGGTHAATPTVRQLGSLLQRRYPAAERAAWAMQGVHPLNPGDISHVINALARTRYADALKGNNPSSWHADGGVFTEPSRIGVGEGGPEAVIPLNDQGANFLAMAIHGAEARGIGMGSMPMRGGMSIYNTRIDKSTNFTGAITVQANDPAELIHKLQARQRVMALSRPSLTGSAA